MNNQKKAEHLSFIHQPTHTHAQEAAAVKAAQVQVLAESTAAAAIISAAATAAVHARAAAEVAAIGAQTPDTTLAIKNEVERVRLAVAAEVERVRIVTAATAATAAGTNAQIHVHILYASLWHTLTCNSSNAFIMYTKNVVRASTHTYDILCILDI